MKSRWITLLVSVGGIFLLLLSPNAAHASWTADDEVIESSSSHSIDPSTTGLATAGWTLSTNKDAVTAFAEGSDSVTGTGGQYSKSTVDVYVKRTYVQNGSSVLGIVVTASAATSLVNNGGAISGCSMVNGCGIGITACNPCGTPLEETYSQNVSATTTVGDYHIHVTGTGNVLNFGCGTKQVSYNNDGSVSFSNP